jgi:hypothetical protein
VTTRLPGRAILATLVVALPASEVGHYAAYVARLGPAAAGVQAAGAHAYYLPALQLLLAASGGAVLLALAVVATARALAGIRRDDGPTTAWPLLPLVLLLFGVQLGVFVGQELLEGASPSAGLLLFGVAGQAPVALLAAVALRSLTATVTAAVRTLRSESSAGRPPRLPVLTGPTPAALEAVAGPARSSLSARAPPSALLA